eukprot:542283_1
MSNPVTKPKKRSRQRLTKHGKALLKSAPKRWSASPRPKRRKKSHNVASSGRKHPKDSTYFVSKLAPKQPPKPRIRVPDDSAVKTLAFVSDSDDDDMKQETELSANITNDQGEWELLTKQFSDRTQFSDKMAPFSVKDILEMNRLQLLHLNKYWQVGYDVSRADGDDKDLVQLSIAIMKHAKNQDTHMKSETNPCRWYRLTKVAGAVGGVAPQPPVFKQYNDDEIAAFEDRFQWRHSSTIKVHVTTDVSPTNGTSSTVTRTVPRLPGDVRTKYGKYYFHSDEVQFDPKARCLVASITGQSDDSIL